MPFLLSQFCIEVTMIQLTQQSTIKVIGSVFDIYHYWSNLRLISIPQVNPFIHGSNPRYLVSPSLQVFCYKYLIVTTRREVKNTGNRVKSCSLFTGCFWSVEVKTQVLVTSPLGWDEV